LDKSGSIVVGSAIDPIVTQPQWVNLFRTNEETLLQEKMRTECKIQFEGGNGVGPARAPKSAKERRKEAGHETTL
jgi:hypothetical protein